MIVAVFIGVGQGQGQGQEEVYSIPIFRALPIFSFSLKTFRNKNLISATCHFFRQAVINKEQL
jgi:hypothetical protein